MDDERQAQPESMHGPGRAHPPPDLTLLFDGVCNLCNAGVLFIIKRDRRGRVRFAPLQSEAALRLLEEAGVAALPEAGEADPDSMIVIERLPGGPGGREREGGKGELRVYDRSAAALRIARALRWPWPLLGAFWIVPRPLRDWIYRIIARNRYRWFGRRDACMMPTPELQARFL